jgi:predicted PurR-regulated permease PerM
MDKKQVRILSIVAIIAILFGAYFLRGFFSVIALAAIVAFLTNPIYKYFLKKFKHIHLALWLTFVTSLILVIIPTFLVILVTVNQAIDILNKISSANFDINALVNQGNIWINKLPFSIDPISTGEITSWLKENVGVISKSAANILVNLAGGFTSFFASVVIFVYVYLAFLRHQNKIIEILKKIDPLGNKTTSLYLEKMGAMTTAMVKGQFSIAILQGLTDAALLYIVGVDYFIFWFVFITFLSIIPLGGGIIVIPAGIILILTGNIWQGILLIAGHIIIVTNIDNVLRPRFVPKSAYLEPALTMLGVFAGLAMFGFLGIIIGPVIMIILVTTIKVYLNYLEQHKFKTNQ